MAKKDSFDKIIDSFTKKIDNIIDKLSIRDIVWLMTWSSLVYASYVTLETIDDRLDEIFNRPFGMIIWLMENWILPHMGVPIEEPPTEPPIPEWKKVNWYSLSLAMGAAWIIMNTTVDDIKDAIGSVTQLLKPKLKQ